MDHDSTPARDDDGITMAAALSEARRKAGDPSIDALWRQIYDRIGTFAPTQETVRRLHKGQVSPASVDPLLVTTLCDVYGINVEDVSLTVARRARTYRDLLIRQMRCFLDSLVARDFASSAAA